MAINAYVPNLLQDIVAPLWERGIPEDMIAWLAGDPRDSDLRENTHWDRQTG